MASDNSLDIEKRDESPQKYVSEYDPDIQNPMVTVKSSIREQIEENQQDADKVVGLELYEEAQLMSAEEIDAEHSKIRFKIDLHLMPILCITYMLQFLDKLSLNYASAYSFKEDLNLTGQRYSWVAAIFNFGYLFWSLPSNYIIQRVPVAKYTALMLFCWAVILVGHIGAKNYGGILVLRFILGMFEASIAPSCMAICSMFYTKKEQPLRMCTFLSFNGCSTMLGALLGYGLGHATESKLKPWKLIFLVIGLLNFVWCIVFFMFCPDSPTNAKFLSSREKAIIVEKISRNNMGIKDIHFKKYQALESLTDYKTYIYIGFALGTGIVNGGASNFQSALLRGFGFDGISATLLQLPTGAFELIVVFAAGVLAITFKDLRCYLFALTCVPGLAGLIGIHVIDLKHKWALVGCTWLQYIAGGPIILTWILLAANVAGHSKRTVTNGIYFTFYAAGNIIGANIFYTNQAPKYVSGIIGLLVCYAAMIVLVLVYRGCIQYENHLRDKECGGYTDEIAQQAVIDGFKDLTDRENRGYRYSL